jgi:hypothetical protein
LGGRNKSILGILSSNDKNALSQFYNFGWAHRDCNVYKSAYILPNLITKLKNPQPITVDMSVVTNDPIHWNRNSINRFPHGLNDQTLSPKFKLLFSTFTSISDNQLNNIVYVACVALYYHYIQYRTEKKLDITPEIIQEFNREISILVDPPEHSGGGFKLNTNSTEALVSFFKYIKQGYTQEELDEIEEKIRVDTATEDELSTLVSKPLQPIAAGRRRKRTKQTRRKRTRHR